jgi:hypothetical protein
MVTHLRSGGATVEYRGLALTLGNDPTLDANDLVSAMMMPFSGGAATATRRVLRSKVSIPSGRIPPIAQADQSRG